MADFLLDTNVALRLCVPESPDHEVATKAVARLLLERHRVFVAAQVLIEFWVAATRPVDVNGLGWTMLRTTREIDRLLARFRLLPDLPAIFSQWYELVRLNQVQGKWAHDARLAALMTLHGVPNILTLNVADFAGLPIRAVSPQELLAA